jgi:hypothetical protein
LVGSNASSLGFICRDEIDPLWKLNESIVHPECLDRHARKTEILGRNEQYHDHVQPTHICQVCHQTVQNPDDWTGTAIPSDDLSEPVWRYGYAQFHKDCLPHWEELPSVIERISASLDSGRLRGRPWQKDLEELRQALGKRGSQGNLT